MKKVYNYKKINKRIEELNDKRDVNERFVGTDSEMNELMSLATYKREDLAHALCLDFQTKVTKIENYFKWTNFKVRLSQIVIELDKKSYVVETEDIKEEKGKSYNFNQILVLKPIFDGKTRRFLLKNRDISCFDCYFIGEEIDEKVVNYARK